MDRYHTVLTVKALSFHHWRWNSIWTFHIIIVVFLINMKASLKYLQNFWISKMKKSREPLIKNMRVLLFWVWKILIMDQIYQTLEVFKIMLGVKERNQFILQLVVPKFRSSSSWYANNFIVSAHLYANWFSCIWDNDACSFKCLLKSMLEYINNRISAIDGLQLFLYIKSIGSKFKTIFTSISELNERVSRSF